MAARMHKSRKKPVAKVKKYSVFRYTNRVQRGHFFVSLEPLCG